MRKDKYVFWRFTGSFPSSGETNNVTGCSAGYNGDCCVNSYKIQVKNCSRFLVYNLQPTIACPEGYCFGKQHRCTFVHLLQFLYKTPRTNAQILIHLYLAEESKYDFCHQTFMMFINSIHQNTLLHYSKFLF